MKLVKQSSEQLPVGSIQRQLLWLLGISLPLLWFIIGVIAAVPLYLQMNTASDDFLQQTARSLLAEMTYLEENTASTLIDEWQSILAFSDSEDLDVLNVLDTAVQSQNFAFAVWDKTGRLLDADGEAVILPYRQQFSGFVDSDSRWKKTSWRIYYYNDLHSGKTVAVAQAWKSRWFEMKAAISEQLGILLLTLPLLLAVVIWSVRRGLRPLLQLTQTLNQRHAHDLSSVNYAVPKELQPLTTALNQLFARVSQTMAREQRFTADAAHELRSPLAAIKVQTEELLHHLPHVDDKENRQSFESIQRIQRVTHRASHLVEQLLMMAQLDNHQPVNYQTVDWLSLSDTVLQSVSLLAREKHISLKRYITADTPETILPLNGDATLLTLLLRNLLDNAVRYSIDESDENNTEQNQSNNVVELTLANDHISVRDHGKGINPEHLNRVRERFFRPAGQTEIGSGLGLSIVERIAELHGLTFSLDNHPDGGVVAKLRINDVG